MTSPQSRPGLRWPAIITFAACTVSVALGFWQLQRLAGKEILIALVSTRVTKPPEPLPDPATWSSLRTDDYEYRHVALDGIFEHDKEALVFRGSGGGTTGLEQPGYLVLTPLRLASGAYVIVNRGFVPQSLRDRGTRAETESSSETHLTGLMRPPEPRNLFTPPDDPANGRYFTRDPAMIAAHFGLQPAAPFSVDADAMTSPGGWPKGGTTELRFANNHLAYAATWFGIALTAAGVFSGFAWQNWRNHT